MGDAEAWVIHSNPASTTHVAEGKQQLDQLNLLVRKLGPCAGHAFFQPVEHKASKLLATVSESVFKTAATSPAAAGATAASATVTTHPKTPAPYKVDAPTFSGKIRDFHQFYERFSALMNIHGDAYSDGDKANILAHSMQDREAKNLVELYAATSYAEAMEQLKARYGRA